MSDLSDYRPARFAIEDEAEDRFVVTFALLGSLVVVADDGHEVVVTAAKARTLLVALAIDAGRTVSAEHLVDAVWDDDPPSQPLVSLRSYVSNLRRVLPSAPGRPLLVTRPRGWSLDVAPEAVDLHRFARLADDGHRLLADGDPADALGRLDEALDLWRGPALVDVADLRFARPTILRLEGLRERARQDRAAALLALDRPADVVADLEAMAHADPLDERPQLLLMQALHRTGRTAEALAVHRAHRQRLAEEVGIDPGPRIEDLAARILRGDDLVGGRGPAPRPTSASPAAPRGEDAAVVGRERELATVDEALARLAGGRGRVLVVSGEPGIGKSTLLDAVGRRATAAGLPVAAGRAPETPGAPPYHAVRQVLRDVLPGVDDRTVADALGTDAHLVATLVPELAERVDVRADLPPPEPNAARWALHEAVTALLAAAARPRGLVVLVDDLHWADAATAELVAHLAGHAEAGRLLLVVAHRVAAVDRSPVLDDALAAVARQPGTVQLALAGLDRRAVTELVEARLQGDRDLLDLVHDRAGGNPFFVQELLRLAVDVGHVDLGSALPPGVRPVVERRLRALPAEVRATLEVAAVLGGDIGVAAVAEVCGTSRAVVLEHVDVAVAHGLLAPAAGDGPAAVRFVHALVRETLEAGLGRARLVAVHGAAAARLLGQASPPARELAEHLWRAAEVGDVATTVTWLRAAAEEALAVFDLGRAEADLQRALRLLGGRRETAALEVAVGLELLQVLVSRHGWSAASIADVAGRLERLAHDGGVAGPAAALVGWSTWGTWMTRGDRERQWAAAARMLEHAARTGDEASEVAGHVASAYTGVFAGWDAGQLALHVRAARAAEQRVDPAVLEATPENLSASLRIAEVLAAAFAGDAAAVADRLADLDATTADLGPRRRAQACMFTAFALALVDDHESTRARAAEGLAHCERVGLAYYAALTGPLHAWACARAGADPVAEEARMVEGLAFLDAAGHRHAVALWLLLLAEVRAIRGDDLGARRALDEATARAEEVHEADAFARRLDVAARLVAAARRSSSAAPADRRLAVARAAATASARG